MSKFYVAGNISDQSDDDEVQKNVEADKNRKKKFDVDDDDNYHQEKNKMQTEKQKKNAVFKKLSSTTISAVNIGDFDRAWDALQQFIKEIQKSAKYIQKQGLPALFLKTLKIVNKQVSSVDAQAKKSMKNPKSFNIMRQKLKNKIIPQYKDKLDNFKEQPSAQQQSEQSEQKEQISSSDESQEQVYKKYLESDDPHIRRKYWLKRQKKPEEEQEGRKDVKQDGAEKRKPSQPTKPKHHITIVQKKKQQLIIASAKQAEAEMTKILKQFAKLNSTQKRQEYLEKLDSISKQSTNYPDFQKLSFLLVDIPIRFQVTRQLVRYLGETNFSRTSWNKIFNNVVSIFTLLRQSQDDDLLAKIATFQEQNQQAKLGTTQKDVYGQIKSFINSLERELSRAFDFLETNEDQYSERLQDLIKFIEFMYKLSNQMAFKQGLQKEAAQISFKVLENMYFMNSQFLQKIRQFSPDLTFTQLSDQKTLQLYIKPILKLNKQDYTTKTLLYAIYNYSINRRDKGKDLLILTDISQTIATRDYYTQVCFNRALVQLGVSAFYQGNVYETQQILSGIVTKKEKKEENLKLFLGQARPNDKDTVRHKQLPRYLHINTDLVEAIELIASMILQVPYTLNQGSKITSRTYKKLVQHYERTHYISDPSNYKDLIYTASNELKLGNMKKCYEKLSRIYIWNQLGNPQVALQNLKQNLKQTALKCYIANNKKCFTSISLENIAQKFEMDVKAARKIICRQISQRKVIGVITSDGYLKLTQKRKQKESGLANINSNLFLNIQQLNKANEQIFKQRIEVDAPEAQDQAQKQKTKKKLHDVITEKLKNILSRRAA